MNEWIYKLLLYKGIKNTDSYGHTYWHFDDGNGHFGSVVMPDNLKFMERYYIGKNTNIS